ncbi:MAG: C45 family autoproteolytic acyltransferase/hydrolase, partial [Thermoguttaceae bacterium]|nr:C45 family autoproteolytic acyltransferase/hydrolase [Thermoguttaceae bacterium]
LLTGECDMIVCAGGNRAMGLPTYEQLSMSGYLAKGDPKSPFDAKADGFVPGEGVGVLLLKRLSDAQRDGDTIYGIVRGNGAGYCPSGEKALETAIRRGLAAAGASPDDVAVVETAAMGVPKADRKELDALQRAYGTGGRKAPLWLGSTVAQLGCLHGASGMVSLIKAVCELDRREVPRTFGLEEPADWVAAQQDLMRLPSQTERLATANPEGRLLAGIDCFDITGLAHHVLLERPTPVPRSEVLREAVGQPAAAAARRAVPQPVSHAPAHPLLARDAQVKIVRVGGRDLGAVLDRVRAIAADPGPVFREANGTPFGRSDRVRVAIVATSPEELAEKAQLAAANLDKPECRPLLEGKGIFQGHVPEHRAKIAFLFAGQGSQYAGMLKSLVREYPPAAEAVRRVDETLVRLGFPTFAQVAWEQGEALGTDVWRTQLSLLVAETVLYSSLLELGVRPDRISSHSYGEFPALLAAGAWTFEADVLATHARCRVVEQCKHANGGMLSVAASMEEVDQWCRQTNGRVHVANWNAPRQTVVGGDHEALAEFEQRLRAQGIAAKRIPVPRPFHTPLMSEVKVPFRKALEEIVIQPPRIPMLSSVSGRYVAEPDEIRDNLANQMAVNVRYVELIRRLADEGVTAFVEVGPNQVLTGLHRKILEGRPVAMVASDNRKGSGVEQLLFVRACAETTGALDDETSPVTHPVPAMFEGGAGRRSAGQVAAQPAPAEQVAPEPAPAETVSTGQGPVDQGSAPLSPSRIEPREKPATPVRNGSGEPPASEAPGPGGLRVIVMRGTPYEMGRAHGHAHGKAIRRILRRYADLPNHNEDELAAVEAATAQIGTLLGPDDLEEMRGIADGAEVALASIVAHNLRIYPDHGAGCVHFAVSGRSNAGVGLVHAGNDDVPLALVLRHCLERNVQVRFPQGGIPHVSFAMAGQMAASIGINAKGLAITGAMLLDRAPQGTAVRGLVHSAVVKRILQEAEDIDQAIDVLRRTPGCGAWGLCLTHHPTDQICYVEYDGATLQVGPREDFFTGANHSLLLPVGQAVPAHSQHRLTRLRQLVGQGRSSGVAVAEAQAVLRDRFDVARGRQTRHPTMNTIRRVDNQLSVVMQPAQGKVWVTRGPAGGESASADDDDEQYHCLDLEALFATESPRPPKAAAEPASRASKADRDDWICRRYVLRMIEAPLPAEPSPFAWQGASVILGQNPASEALARRIERAGGKAAILPATETVEGALASLEEVWRRSPAPHLFLMTPHDGDARTKVDGPQWLGRQRSGVKIPFYVTQRWLQLVSAANLLDRASVLGATALGGDFGFSGSVVCAESGAVAGLIKALRSEVASGQQLLGKFRVKVVDATVSTTADQLAEYLLRELAADDLETEISYLDGKRFVARPFAQAVGPIDEGAIRRGGTWVITGGARGITAVVARELGTRFGLKLHLIGSSPPPAIDPAWRDLSPADLRE